MIQKMFSGLLAASLLVAVGACGQSGSETQGANELDLRLPSDDEVCALITPEDLPGDTFEPIPGSGSVSSERGGRTAATYLPGDDPSIKEGFVPADASCSWVGGSGTTAGLIVVDYGEQPDLLAVPVEDLVAGPPADEHRLLTVDGFDQLAVTPQSSVFASAAGASGPYVLTAHASFLDDSDGELTAEFLTKLFSRWLEAARSVDDSS